MSITDRTIAFWSVNTVEITTFFFWSLLLVRSLVRLCFRFEPIVRFHSTILSVSIFPYLLFFFRLLFLFVIFKQRNDPTDDWVVKAEKILYTTIKVNTFLFLFDFAYVSIFTGLRFHCLFLFGVPMYNKNHVETHSQKTKKNRKPKTRYQYLSLIIKGEVISFQLMCIKRRVDGPDPIGITGNYFGNSFFVVVLCLSDVVGLSDSLGNGTARIL